MGNDLYAPPGTGNRNGRSTATRAARELRDVRGRGGDRGPRRGPLGCLGRVRPAAALGRRCRRRLHRGRERPQRCVRPGNGPGEPSGTPAPRREGERRCGEVVRGLRLYHRGEPCGPREPLGLRDRPREHRAHGVLRVGSEVPRRARESRDCLPGRIVVPLRGCERLPVVDRAARPDGHLGRSSVLHHGGPRDHEGHRGHARRRRPPDSPPSNRVASRGRRRGRCLVRRSGLESRPVRPRGPVPRIRDPRDPRGRNVYLRRPPLGGESSAVPARDEVRDDCRPRGLPRRCVRVNVYESILERRRKGPLHMTLLDPDKQTPPDAASLSSEAAAAGTDAIMVGGSTGVTQDKVDATVLAIKEAAKLPVILFPASAANLSPHADALYFMSLLNSRDPRLIVGEQRLAAPIVKAWGLETIPMAYLVVEPGMRAGEIGDAELISRKTPTVAVQYALAAQMLGMKLVYLEAGSGAPEPVPDRVIRAVRDAIDIPVVVGGGIRTPEAAQAVTQAGADIVVTGTIVEVAREGEALRRIIEAVKAG